MQKCLWPHTAAWLCARGVLWDFWGVLWDFGGVSWDFWGVLWCFMVLMSVSLLPCTQQFSIPKFDKTRDCVYTVISSQLPFFWKSRLWGDKYQSHVKDRESGAAVPWKTMQVPRRWPLRWPLLAELLWPQELLLMPEVWCKKFCNSTSFTALKLGF